MHAQVCKLIFSKIFTKCVQDPSTINSFNRSPWIDFSHFAYYLQGRTQFEDEFRILIERINAQSMHNTIKQPKSTHHMPLRLEESETKVSKVYLNQKLKKKA
jgi:hypothetical protein